MRVVDEEDREVADGELGEIVLRGENILKGYYKNDTRNATAFRNGWFHTGDIGYRDADGFYYIVDRKSDMIIRGGENIYPREIDEVLYQHPDIAAAAVVGVPDDLYGEEVAAVMVLKPGASSTEQEVIDFCKARLADFKCPKTVHFVDDIPKGPTGKLLKRELAKMFSPPSSVHGWANLCQRSSLNTIDQPRANQPQRADPNHDRRKPFAVETIRRKLFGGVMQRFAVGQQTSFSELVERVDRDLDHEEQQEDARNLEEAFDIDQVTKLGPTDRKQDRRAQTKQARH